MVYALKIECERLLFEPLELFFREHVGLVHLFEHHIAALACALGLADGVEIRRVFHHAHKGSRFEHVEVGGRFVEVDFCGAFDAHGVIEKVELVEIHLQNLFFGVEAFEFDSNHPFDGFLHGAREQTVRRGSVELFCELLRDSGAAAGIFLAHGQGLHNGAEDSLDVDARVVVEACVFCGDESVDHGRRYLVEVGVDTVAGIAEVAAHLLAVARIDYGGELILWILQLFDRGHVTDFAVVD